MDLSEQEAEAFIEDMSEDVRIIYRNLDTIFASVSSTQFNNNKRKDNWTNPTGDLKQKQVNTWEIYESWYVQARELVTEYRPEMEEDFKKGFEDFKSILFLKVNPEAYDSSDALDEITNVFASQQSTLNSVPAKIGVQKLKAKHQLSARMVRDEIQRSRELFGDGFIRAGGIVASVALERHLLTMCEESENIDEYSPLHGISRLSQTLYEGEVINKTDWNDLKALASIRETCAHAEEPEKEAVRRLINEVEEYIRTSK